ncbi:MAG: class I SAM-dependent methyltransferase [Bacteroidota bacterium]
MENLLHCPVCSGNDFKKHLECRDYTVSQELFQIQSCSTCGFLFTNPRPGKSEIGKYYQSSAYISHTNSSKGLFNKLYKVVRNRAIEEKIALIKGFLKKEETIRLLDIGCGTGEFLAGAGAKGWNVVGVEPNQDAAEMGRKNHGLAIHDENWLDAALGTFDVITMWHVLEHVHDLDTRLKQLARLLGAEGLLIIAVPNNTSADSKEFKEHWAAWDVPRHLYHFSPESIKRLMLRYGFEHIGSKPMKYDAYYVSLLSTGYQSEDKNLLSGFISGWKSNKATKGDPEKYSSVIYLFKKQN